MKISKFILRDVIEGRRRFIGSVCMIAPGSISWICHGARNAWAVSNFRICFCSNIAELLCVRKCTRCHSLIHVLFKIFMRFDLSSFFCSQFSHCAIICSSGRKNQAYRSCRPRRSVVIAFSCYVKARLSALNVNSTMLLELWMRETFVIPCYYGNEKRYFLSASPGISSCCFGLASVPMILL